MATRAILDDSSVPLPDVGVIPVGVIPVGEIAPWAVLGLLVATLFLYFVSTEQGAMSLFQGSAIHEFVHDGRHLLGFPCH